MGELVLLAALVLTAYFAGYLVGRSDERRVQDRRAQRLDNARERLWQEGLEDPGNPKMN